MNLAVEAPFEAPCRGWIAYGYRRVADMTVLLEPDRDWERGSGCASRVDRQAGGPAQDAGRSRTAAALYLRPYLRMPRLGLQRRRADEVIE
jgi:hypothetical protein